MISESFLIDGFKNNNNPYVILKEAFSDSLEKFSSEILCSIHEQGIKSVRSLEEIHKYCEQDNINQIRINAFKVLNKINNWEKIIYKSIAPNINYILGLDLAIQTKLNLSIQMPNDSSSLLERHIDYRSGDSPFQIVVWIPLTRAFSTNSMFIEYKEKKKFLNLEAGDILLFDPNYPHGNQINTTDKTRVSLNVRFKNWFAPDLEEKVPDRQFGIYYKDLCFSNSTYNSFALINNNK